MRAFEYRHIVSFEETNLVGNVYYANHVRWQGPCRELFLRDYAPEILEELERDLALVTTRVSCEYFNELFAFDEVIIRMRAGAVSQSRITMLFDYLRVGDGGEQLIARGEQQIACMRRSDSGAVPTPVPDGSPRLALIGTCWQPLARGPDSPDRRKTRDRRKRDASSRPLSTRGAIPGALSRKRVIGFEPTTFTLAT